MASADLRHELDCSICLNIYTDPVTLRCGHSLCQNCTDCVLDTQEESEVYTFPKCRADSTLRPAPQRNITLCNIVDSFLSTRPDQEETGIFCTHCVKSHVPAAKSCLLYKASLCDEHLRVHSKSPEHTLCNPTNSSGNRKCSTHKKILKDFCTEDSVCICVSCGLDGEHRGHKMESLDESSEKKKEKLRNVLEKLITQRQETENKIQRLQEYGKEDQEKAACIRKTVIALFRAIGKHLEDLMKKVLGEIYRQAEHISLSVCDLIQQLEKKMGKLSMRMRDIEELCNISDPVTFLKKPRDWCDPDNTERHEDQVQCGEDLNVDLISETLQRGLSDIIKAMVSVDLRQEQGCSICLNISTDPVTLRCGHSLCQICIDHVLDTQEGSADYTFPECRAEYKELHAQQRNITLYNIGESFLSTHLDEEETRIFCSYCVDSPVPAAKSCFMCEASLCDKHLRVHSKSPEHILCDPISSFGNRKCSTHKKVLEFYCTEDSVCICVSCRLDGEHKGHKVESLDEASEKKKEKLRNILVKMITQRQETENRVQRLQDHWKEDKEKAAGVKETVIALLRDITKHLKDLEKRVLAEIFRQVEHVSLSVCDLIQQLEEKKDQLSKRMHDIEELCNMSDPVTFLKVPGDWWDTDDAERHEEQVHGGRDLDVDLILEILQRGLSDIITGINVYCYVQRPADILLDINTASKYTFISCDRKTASRIHKYKTRSVTPERFQDYSQVISSGGFSSGRHYWEVDVRGSMWWIVGMCYPSIDRRGPQSDIGDNIKSWVMERWYNNDILVTHNSKGTQLPDTIPCDRVRIYLDYEAGQLSFYSLCDPIRHLHTFSTTFTEPLHAALCVWEGCITISGGSGAGRNLPSDMTVNLIGGKFSQYNVAVGGVG